MQSQLERVLDVSPRRRPLAKYRSAYRNVSAALRNFKITSECLLFAVLDDAALRRNGYGLLFVSTAGERIERFLVFASWLYQAGDTLRRCAHHPLLQLRNADRAEAMASPARSQDLISGGINKEIPVPRTSMVNGPGR